MFTKRKEKKAEKDKQEVAELIALQETSLKQIAKRVAGIDATADVGERILKLEELKSYIGTADAASRNKYEEIIHRRVWDDKYAQMRSNAAIRRAEVAKRKQLDEQNPGIGVFADTIKTQKARAAEAFDKTLRTCDLEEVSNSSVYEQVHARYELLRSRFSAAADKQAIKGKSAIKPPAARKSGIHL